MRRLALILLGAVALALPAAAGASTAVEKDPFDTDLTICNGDTVHLTGTLLVASNIVGTPSGGLSTMLHFSPQGVSGVDQQTGLRFNATGDTSAITVFTPAGGIVETLVNRFHIQATRGGQSYEVSETAHLTMTPAGSVSVFFDNFGATC